MKCDMDSHSRTSIGLSRPWAAMICWICVSVNPFCGSRSTLVTGSPGRTLTTKNVTR